MDGQPPGLAANFIETFRTGSVDLDRLRAFDKPALLALGGKSNLQQLAYEEGVSEKAMFGGLAFLLHGNMAVGIANTGELMVRVGPEATNEALRRPPHPAVRHVRPADDRLDPRRSQGVKTRRQLAGWVARSVRFAGGLAPKG